MSLTEPTKNKMMTAAPAQKQQFFFAPTADHPAEVVYANSIEEAEQIYQQRLQPAIKPTVEPISTPAPEKEDETVQ